MDRNLGYFSRGQSNFSKLTHSLRPHSKWSSFCFHAKNSAFSKCFPKSMGEGRRQKHTLSLIFFKVEYVPPCPPLPEALTPLNTTLAHTVIHIWLNTHLLQLTYITWISRKTITSFKTQFADIDQKTKLKYLHLMFV